MIRLAVDSARSPDVPRAHLPDGVRVLPCLDAGAENGPVDFVAHVKHEHGAVVEAHGQQGRVLRVEVERHHARLGGEGVLRVGRVLEAVAADEPTGLLHEVKAAVAHRKQVVVLRVPADGGDVLTLGALVVKLPQRQQRALRGAGARRQVSVGSVVSARV